MVASELESYPQDGKYFHLLRGSKRIDYRFRKSIDTYLQRINVKFTMKLKVNICYVKRVTHWHISCLETSNQSNRISTTKHSQIELVHR